MPGPEPRGEPEWPEQAMGFWGPGVRAYHLEPAQSPLTSGAGLLTWLLLGLQTSWGHQLLKALAFHPLPLPQLFPKTPPTVPPPSPPSSHCPPHPKIPPARYIPVAFVGPLRQHWQEAAFQPLNLTAPPRLRAMGWAGALTEGTPNVRAAGSLHP